MSLWENSWGFKLVFDVGVDITKATKMQIRYRKPNDEAGVWDAKLDTSTSIFYIVCKTDLNVVGIWEFQAHIVTPEWTLPGDVVQELVKSLV